MNKGFQKITESDSRYDDLEKMPVHDLLVNINREDQTVAQSVSAAIPQLEKLIPEITSRLKQGGRLFYIGAGTSGRLGIVDASECPPTFGVPHGLVIAVIAGGDAAIRKAVEFAEDDTLQGWIDLEQYQINSKDVLIGIAASGTTPYVAGALKKAKENNLLTACITCNPGSPVTLHSDYPVEIPVGPEFVTGSTRMKAGTAQKLVLNMISTAVMIGLGRIKGNKMVDMQLSNNKLIERGTRMIMNSLQVSEQEAVLLLEKHGNVRKAIASAKK